MSTIIPSTDHKIATVAQLARAACDEHRALCDQTGIARAAYDELQRRTNAADFEWRGLLQALEGALTRLQAAEDDAPTIPFAIPFTADELPYHTGGYAGQDAYPLLRSVLNAQARQRQQEAA